MSDDWRDGMEPSYGSLSDSGTFLVDSDWLDRIEAQLDASEREEALDDDAAFVERCVEKLKRMPKVRMDRVREIKARVEAGTYGCEETWAQAVEKLRRDLRG